MPIRILIADDHRILRAGLRTMLTADPNLLVIGEATSAEEALIVIQEHHPEIVLMDISMPGLDPLQAVRQIAQTMEGTRVLILTMHEDSALLQEYIRAGASGYIIKRAAESELIDAIYAVWRGIIYIHPSLLHSLVTPKQMPAPPLCQETEPLSSREIEVLRLIVKGFTNRQIGNELSISVRTVETHRSNVMDKLNLHSRVELVHYAMEHGLI